MKSRRLSKIVTVLNNQIDGMVKENWLLNSPDLNETKIKEIKTTLELANFELAYQQLKKAKQ